VNRSLRDYASLVLSQGVRIPLGILSMTILARLLGPDGLGKWSMGIAVATLFHAALLNWTQSSHIRFGREEWVERRSLSGTWAARWPFVVAGLLFSSVALLLNPGNWLTTISGLGDGWGGLVLLCLFSLWVSAEAQSLLQVTDRIGLLAMLPSVVGFATAGYYASLLATDVRSPAIVLAGFAGIQIVVWGVTWLALYRKAGRFAVAPRSAAVRTHLRYAWPMLPGFAIGYASNWGDHLLLQHFFTSREVGLFQSAYRPMLLIVGLATPLTTVLLPRLIAQQMADLGAETRFVRKVVPTITSLWAFLLAPAIALLPWGFQTLMGDSFAPAVPILLVLCIGVPACVLTNLFTVLFSVQKRLGRSVLLVLAMTGVNLGLSVALLPILGPIGAAVGTAASYLLVQFLYVWDQHRYLKISALPMLGLFFWLTTYSVVQALLGAGGPEWATLTIRVGWTAAWMVGLLLIVRRGRLVDPDVLDRMFTGSLSQAGRLASATMVRKCDTVIGPMRVSL